MKNEVKTCTTVWSWKFMSRQLGILLVCLVLPQQTRGATITASGASASQVQAAINSAANGDTVVVPPGNATWSSAISIPGTMYITLSGSGSTIALSSSFNITPHPTGNTRVTGFTFNCSGGALYVQDEASTAAWRI